MQFFPSKSNIFIINNNKMKSLPKSGWLSQRTKSDGAQSINKWSLKTFIRRNRRPRDLGQFMSNPTGLAAAPGTEFLALPTLSGGKDQHGRMQVLALWRLNQETRTTGSTSKRQKCKRVKRQNVFFTPMCKCLEKRLNYSQFLAML